MNGAKGKELLSLLTAVQPNVTRERRGVRRRAVCTAVKRQVTAIRREQGSCVLGWGRPATAWNNIRAKSILQPSLHLLSSSTGALQMSSRAWNVT